MNYANQDLPSIQRVHREVQTRRDFFRVAEPGSLLLPFLLPKLALFLVASESGATAQLGLSTLCLRSAFSSRSS